MYESAFGYTQLRLIVLCLHGLAVAAALLVCADFVVGPHKFAIGFILAAMGFLVTLNLINPDAFIARQNLARYLATNDLDAAYLTTLSDDAVPQLARALSLVQDDEQLVPVPACTGYWHESEWIADYEDCQATPYEILREELDGRYQSMRQQEWRRWQSFHLARWRAFAF